MTIEKGPRYAKPIPIPEKTPYVTNVRKNESLIEK
jgi:hypothetical protein